MAKQLSVLVGDVDPHLWQWCLHEGNTFLEEGQGIPSVDFSRGDMAYRYCLSPQVARTVIVRMPSVSIFKKYTVFQQLLASQLAVDLQSVHVFFRLKELLLSKTIQVMVVNKGIWHVLQNPFNESPGHEGSESPRLKDNKSPRLDRGVHSLTVSLLDHMPVSEDTGFLVMPHADTIWMALPDGSSLAFASDVFLAHQKKWASVLPKKWMASGDKKTLKKIGIDYSYTDWRWWDFVAQKFFQPHFLNRSKLFFSRVFNMVSEDAKKNASWWKKLCVSQIVLCVFLAAMCWVQGKENFLGESSWQKKADQWLKEQV